MKCHYEILGVSRDVGDEELKKAYRKLALKWHPDKNIDNTEEAKEQFQLVQQAYEVLSDPHERAWYDAHREAILKGGLGSDYKDDSLDVFQYFSVTCFKGYGDDEKGFYAVYREVFSKIAAEDLEYMTDEDSDFEIPSFGDSKSSYEEVVHPFYAYWQSYSTKKSYAWLDPYDIRDAPNRRIVRAAEKENKKVREKARKQRNEEVRNLVAFVRKRDKRVQAYVKQLEERAAENARKAEERRKKVLRERQEEIKGYKESEWAKFSNIEKELKEIEANLAQQFGDTTTSSDEEDSREEEDDLAANSLYCVACNKVFKTEKAFANHENSKKHKENAEILKATVLDEEEELKNAEMFDNLCNKDSEHTDTVSESDISELELNETSKNKAKKKSKKSNKNIIQCSLYDVSDNEFDTEIGQSRKQRKKQKHILNEYKKSDILESKEKPGTQAAEVIDTQEPTVNGSVTEDNSKKITDIDMELQDDNRQQPAMQTSTEDQQPKGMGASQKLKKSKEGKKKMNVQSVQDLNHCCVTCHSEFPSKNKLFEHLKKTGHSVHIPHGAVTSRKVLVEEKKKGKSKKSKVGQAATSTKN